MSAVDWAAVHARLENARLALEQALSPGPEAQLEILRRRARALARPLAEPASEQQGLELVTFTLANESYGIEARLVREVSPLKALTPLPGTPAFVRGVVNLRGSIVAVVDLRKFLGMPDKGLSDLDQLIVLESESMWVAVLADAIQGIRPLPASELQARLPAGAGVRGEYLLGMSADGLAVLAADRFLSAPGLLVQQDQGRS